MQNKISITAAINIGLLLFFIAAGVMLHAILPIDDYRFVSFDSVNYRQKAVEACNDPLAPISKAISNRDPVALNWATIVSMGAVACKINPINFDKIILGINLAFFALFLIFYRKILYIVPTSLGGHLIILSLLFFQTWLAASLISLNKEILSYFFVSFLAFSYLKKNVWLLILAGILAGLTKFQFFIFSLMLIASLVGINFKYQLICIASFLSIFYKFFDFSIFDTALYFSRFEDNIRSAEIAILLNKIVEYPLGFIVVMPIRLVANLLSGFSPMRIMSIDSWQEFMYQVNAMVMSLASIFMVTGIAMRKFSQVDPLVKFTLLYFLLICVIPFFQLRYFFPVLPIIIVILFQVRRKYLGVNKSAIYE